MKNIRNITGMAAALFLLMTMPQNVWAQAAPQDGL